LTSWHSLIPSHQTPRSCHLALEDLDRIALAELHDRLFPARPTADELAHALFLPALIRGPHVGHLHAEQLLDGRANLRLRRIRMDLKRVLAAVLIRRRGLLGDQGTDDGLV